MKFKRHSNDLDTTLLIDVLRGNKAALSEVARHEKIRHLFAVAPSLTELLAGALLSNLPETEKILELREALYCLLMKALKAEEIDAQLTKKGEQINYVDILIAATAIVNHQTILTRNTKDFSKKD